MLLVNFVIIITNRYWNYYIPIILLLYIHVDIIVGTFLKFILRTRTYTYTNTQLLSSKNKQDPGTKTPSPIQSASLGHHPIPNPVSILESEDGSKAYRRIPIKFSNPTRSTSLGHHPIPNPVSIFEYEDGSEAYRQISIKLSNPTRL